MKEILAWCSVLVVCAAAEPLTWERLISSVDEDPVLKAASQRQTAISNRTGTKLWENLELDYKLDGLGFMKHDMELKIKPRAFGEASADAAYWKAQGEYQKSVEGSDRASVLYERYEHALRYVTRYKIQQLHLQLFQICEDRIEVLHAKTGSESFDLQDLVTALEKKASLSAELIADSNAIKDSKMKLLSFTPDLDSIALDSAWLPTIDELKSILNNASYNPESYAEVAKTKAKWLVDQKRYEEEMAGDRDYISKIGVGYVHEFGEYKYKWVTTSVSGTNINEEWRLQRSDDDRRTIDKFYIDVGIKLPFFASNGTTNLKRQIDVLESERDYLKVRRDASQKISRMREEIMGLMAQRDVQKNFVDQVDAGALFQDFAAKAGNDPLLLLRARESALESTLKIVKLDSDIFDVYLDLLNEMGSFARTDVENHFKAGLSK
ncbi:MAG: hypothetical protein M0P13_06720 [Fibrobacteraceae bacterium]|nr:hypothetical protein [Fibrobacteraceae bacterium]